MTVFDVNIDALSGGPADLAQYRGRTMLIVNVASQCGLTPQYAALQQLYQDNRDRGLVVLGVPCNQFGGQEPGAAAEIAEFCQANYGVTFPLTEKIEVNGNNRHPLYQELVGVADAGGHVGDIRWNFEKFLIAPDGHVAARFSPQTKPDDPSLSSALEPWLAASSV